MIDPRYGAFYLLTGATFMVFASGFGVCLFNLETVNACVAEADSWVEPFKAMGDHLIAWATAMIRTVFNV